jgi:hypothetical protein
MEVFAVNGLCYLYYACMNKCNLAIVLDTVKKESYGWYIFSIIKKVEQL